MSRLTIPKNPLQDLDQDYTRLPFFLSPIDIQGHITQKPDFSIAPSLSSLTHTFSLHWGNLNLFGPKRPEQIQTWLKLYPLTGIPHETSLIQKNLSRQFTLLQHIKSVSPTIRVPKQKKEKWKNGKRIMIFPSCIWDIWMNPNQRNPHQINEKSENSRKRKIWSD